MDQNRNGIPGEAADRYTAAFAINPVYTFTANGPASIRDNAAAGLTVTINQDIRIADLNVRVHLTHPNDGDLYVHLRGPDGTDVVLANRRGASGDNFWVTVFDDEAATPVAGGAAPFTGSFRPDGALSAFDGKNARGTWQLWVEDRAAGNQGVLHYFSLIIEGAVSGGAASASSAGGVEPSAAGPGVSDGDGPATIRPGPARADRMQDNQALLGELFNLPGPLTLPSGGAGRREAPAVREGVVVPADAGDGSRLERRLVDLVFAGGHERREEWTFEWLPERFDPADALSSVVTSGLACHAGG